MLQNEHFVSSLTSYMEVSIPIRDMPIIRSLLRDRYSAEAIDAIDDAHITTSEQTLLSGTTHLKVRASNEKCVSVLFDHLACT